MPYLRTENLKNHTLFRGTYLYSPYMGILPGRAAKSGAARNEGVSVIITSWLAIALDEIRTRRILREKVDCKQSTRNTPRISQFIIDSVHFVNQNFRWILPYICLIGGG